VATVTDGYLESESLSRLNGQAAVSVYIQKESSANTLKTSRAIQLALDSAWREGGLAKRRVCRGLSSATKPQGIQSALVSVRVSLLAGVFLILLALCVFESRQPATKKAAVWLLSGLMGVMVVAALMKKGDAFLEPYLSYALLGCMCWRPIIPRHPRRPDCGGKHAVVGAVSVFCFFTRAEYPSMS
jgi:hypothetical protein